MLYNSKKTAYELLGAYHVHRKPMALSWDKNRKYTALSFRIKGSSTFICGGQKFPAEDNDVLYIPAGSDFCHENGTEEILVIHLLCHNEHLDTIYRIHGTKDLEQAFYQVVQLWQGKASYNRTMAALYQLFELLEIQAGKKNIPSVIAPGVELLQSKFRDPALTVAQLAECCYISQVYFRRLFHQHFGITPQQAILNLRFEYAADLLRSGYYTPKQAAAQCGFSDVKYFRTAFTKHFECTPTEFINKNI